MSFSNAIFRPKVLLKTTETRRRPRPLRGRGREAALAAKLFFSQRTSFLKKKRLRQAASWRKMVFVIFSQKQKKGACGKPPAGGKLCFSFRKHIFPKKLKCLFLGLFLHQKLFLKTSKKWRRPWPRSGHGCKASILPKMSFLTKKRRLRQRASRGKLSFSARNTIFGQRKAPAAIGQSEGKNFGQNYR